VRTGVTVILPHGGNLFREKVAAAVHTINGFGKPCGFEQVRELGLLEAPIGLTNTLNVGLVLDALVQSSIQASPEIGITASSVNIVVGETNDGYLNDIQGRHVQASHVWSAIQTSSPGPVLEGAVGAGTGTICMGWKGGIGTASRVLSQETGGFHLGVLVQTNFGSAGDLVVLGVPVGRLLTPTRDRSDRSGGHGSVMIVLATNAPLEARQLERLCRRAAAGLARVGSHYSHGSGDFVVAFSTTRQSQPQPAALIGSPFSVFDEKTVLEEMFLGVVECVEEAVLNSLTCAETMTGRDGHTALGIPLTDLKAIVSRHQKFV
jgi:D-aminopeptidase